MFFFFFNRGPRVIEQKLRPHDLRGCAEVYKVAVGVRLPILLNTDTVAKMKPKSEGLWFSSVALAMNNNDRKRLQHVSCSHG